MGSDGRTDRQRFGALQQDIMIIIIIIIKLNKIFQIIRCTSIPQVIVFVKLERNVPELNVRSDIFEQCGQLWCRCERPFEQLFVFVNSAQLFGGFFQIPIQILQQVRAAFHLFDRQWRRFFAFEFVQRVFITRQPAIRLFDIFAKVNNCLN